MKTSSHRDYEVSAFREAALDAGDAVLIAVARRLTVALRLGWKTHALASDVAIMRATEI